MARSDPGTLAGNPPRRMPPVRRPPEAAPASGSDAGSRATAATGSLVLLLFIASLLIPANFTVAGLLFTPYRVLLIPLIIPLFLRLIRDREHPLNIVDCLIMGFSIWQAFAMVYNHGLSRIPFVMGSTVDEFGAYLVGRMVVRDENSYRAFFKYFFWGLMFLLPFAVVELLTRRNLLFEIVSIFATPNQKAGQPPRFGLNRVQASFSHSILYGVYCSVGIANLYYIYRHRFFAKWPKASLAAFMTFMSLSSAAVIAMAIQILVMIWEHVSRAVRGRWIILGSISAFVALVTALVLGGGAIDLFLEKATFDPRTGLYRLKILEYGSAEIARNPIFGIGYKQWVRAWWMDTSVDNFWVATAMRFGLPTALFYLAALLTHFTLITSRKDLTPRQESYRLGYMIAWSGAFFALATVNVFSALSPFLMAYIGAGAWFYSARPPAGPERMPARIRQSHTPRARAPGNAPPVRTPGNAPPVRRHPSDTPPRPDRAPRPPGPAGR